jgi:single-stranded-DNA-specific exonuclease
MAAGVSLAESQVPAFRKRLNEVAAAELAPEHLVPKLRLDAICTLDEIDARLVDELERLEPFGQGNPSVQIGIENVRHTRAPQRLKDEHWKMWLTNGSKSIVALWWGAGDRQCPTGDFDLAAVPEWSDFDGQRQLQLKVLECRER